MTKVHYEVWMAGGFLMRFDRPRLDIDLLDDYNQIVNDNPEDKVQLIEISTRIVRTNGS